MAVLAAGSINEDHGDEGHENVDAAHADRGQLTAREVQPSWQEDLRREEHSSVDTLTKIAYKAKFLY